MESYLKEEDPVGSEWLEKNLGWVEEINNSGRILNVSGVRNVCINHSEFEHVIHLPNNRKSFKPLEEVLKTFLEEECTDNLNYFLSTEIDRKNNVINIFILPIVESA